jgi:hypothetical protein
LVGQPAAAPGPGVVQLSTTQPSPSSQVSEAGHGVASSHAAASRGSSTPALPPAPPAPPPPVPPAPLPHPIVATRAHDMIKERILIGAP